MRAFRQEPTFRAEDLAAMEAEVTATSASAGPSAWLRLEQAYRLCGRLHSAESTLRRALEHHPADTRLVVRLIELLPLRRKWAEAAKLWDGLDAVGRRHGTGLTYARVARSLRELNDRAEALAVAEEGAGRFDHEPELAREMFANRAALVDWGKAVSAAHPGPEPGPAGEVGVVIDLGFLSGGDRPISGRLTQPASRDARVSLLVNGLPVAVTGVAPDQGAATFSLACHDVREFLGDGDVVSIECDGQPLAIEGHGRRRQISTGYESRFGELERRLAAGHVFTKFGVLVPGNTPQRKRETLDLFAKVATVVAESCGHVAYPFYGNLLGAVRDHDFIGHDVGGFDMGYVSRETEPVQVRQEFLRICRALVDHDFQLRLEPWSAYVRRHGAEAYVDLNYAWFNERGELGLSFGWRFRPVTDRDHFFHPREGLIAGRLVQVPGNAEAVLEQLYGSSWAIPEQGFAVEAGLERDPSRLLTRAEQEELFAYSPDRVLIRSVLAEDGQVVAYPGD